MKNTSLKYGIIGGVLVSIYLVAIYFADKGNITNSLLTYWLPLFLIYPILLFQVVRVSPGEAEFRLAVRPPFTTFAVANVFFWLCLYGIHLADPELSKMELGQQLNYAQEQLKQGVGDPQQMNKLRQSINDIQAEISSSNGQPMGPYIFSLCIWMILGFGISAAMTAIFRKK